MKRLLVIAALLFAVSADARPGGGGSYSSGGGSYHSSSAGYSSGAGGGGDLPPEVALGILVMFGIFGLIALALPKTTAWNSSTRTRPPDLTPLLAADPDFSQSMFEDFAFALYSAAQRARTDPAALAKLAPYLSPGVASELAGRATPVRQVVVGALHVEGLTIGTTNERIGVRIESNLALEHTTHACVEHLAFSRALGVRTRPPTATHTWPCPSCGAPWSPADGNPRVCGHCGKDMAVGAFDWAVDYIAVESETDVGPTLTGTVEEVGNDYPTVIEPASAPTFDALTRDDPAVTWPALTARITMIYNRLNEAWNASTLTPVRGLVTASLQDYLRYWLDEYRHQSLSNHLDAAQISNLQLAKAHRDRYFDAVTVRVFASGNDYTLDSKGAVVGGSRTARRAYTEYWTFVRSSTRRGPVLATPSCPNCGAPLAIADAGTCTHCDALIENGGFDWVLSKIEQDDVYTG